MWLMVRLSNCMCISTGMSYLRFRSSPPTATNKKTPSESATARKPRVLV